MAQSARRLVPQYNRKLLEVVRTDGPEYPVLARFENLQEGRQEEIRARYLVGCDGARSMVRKSLGHRLKGESARQLWGVMDILAVTDFPDIRLKCAIQSASNGSLLIIPREGGYMVRMYIEIDELRNDERATESKFANVCKKKFARTEEIEKASEEAGVHVSVVAGRWQKENGDYKKFSRLIERNTVREMLKSA